MITLPETNSSQPKNDGETNRNLRISRGLFYQGRAVSFREGITGQITIIGFPQPTGSGRDDICPYD